MPQQPSRLKFGLVAALLGLVLSANYTLHAQTLQTIIPLTQSGGVSVNAATGLVYAANYQSVAVIDEKTNRIAYEIPVPTPNYVFPVAINPVTNLLYVGDLNFTYVFNASTRKYVATINAPATSIAINYATNRIYVSDFVGDVFVIDGATNNILADISPVGGGLVAVNSATSRIYVTEVDSYQGKIYVLDGKTNTVLTTVIDGGYLDYGLAVDPLRNLVYVADGLGTLSVIDGATNKLASTVQLGGSPCCAAVNPITQKIYVTNQGNLQTVDGKTDTVVKSTVLGQGLSQATEFVDVDLIRGTIYVAAGNAIAVLSAK